MENDEELFAGAKTHAVAFALLEETYQECMTLCQENGWNEEEGLLTVFANGLAYLKNERDFSRWSHQDRDAELLRLARYGNDMNAGYSVMKFRAFSYRQAVQTLEFNVTGLHGLLAHAEATINRLRAENENLRAELAKRT
jgi:hypothetical protein